MGSKERKKKKARQIEDLMLIQKEDRRRLANVPDATKVRSNQDRRSTTLDLSGNADMDDFVRSVKAGIRYQVDYEVIMKVIPKIGRARKIKARGVDISTTGILLEFENDEWKELVENSRGITLKFEIIAGTMPEGYEMKVNMPVHLVRTVHDDKAGKDYGGFVFEKTLAQYSARRKDAVMLTSAMVLILFIYAVVMLMRAESIIYFKFNKWLYLYSIITATFLLSRYLFGALYRTVPVDPNFVPGVTVLIPCFNEEEWIKKTIISCVNQDYPVDKLEIIVIDDHSSDHSVEVIKHTIEELKREGPQFNVADRVSYIVQPINLGKRDALCEGVKVAKHELVVFVDSDSFLDPFAIRYLVQPFKDKKMGGVAGRTDVANTYTNALTKMQAVRYYISFRAMKAAEAYFDVVTCLSGPLSCYRKELIIEHMDEWLNQSFLGQKATFGDDRAMTNIVLRHHRTFYQDTAFCSTIVPNSHKVFLKQQMRWKRSWLRESLTAGTFMWRKEPWSAFFFYIGLIVPVAAPIVVLYNMVYVPITQRIFPTTFIAGLLLMSMLMSVVQLLLRRSSTWLYGMLFCVYYEFVLLWQMPWAWVTFWKSTWGTRETAGDVKEIEKKRARENKDKAILKKRAQKKLDQGKKLTEFEKLLLEDPLIGVSETPTAVATTVATSEVNNIKKPTTKDKTQKKSIIAVIAGGIKKMFSNKNTTSAVYAEEKTGVEQMQALMIEYAKSMADMEEKMSSMYAEHAKIMVEFSKQFEKVQFEISSMTERKVDAALYNTPVVPVEPVAVAEPVVQTEEPETEEIEEVPVEAVENNTEDIEENTEIPEVVEEEAAEEEPEVAKKEETVDVTPVAEEEEPKAPAKKGGLFKNIFGKKSKKTPVVEEVAVEAAAVTAAVAAAEVVEAVAEETAEVATETVEEVEEETVEITADSVDAPIVESAADFVSVDIPETPAEEIVEAAEEETEEADDIAFAPVSNSLFDIDEGAKAAIENGGLFPEEEEEAVEESVEQEATVEAEEEIAEEVEEEEAEETVEEVEEEPAAPAGPVYNPETDRAKIEELLKDHEKESAATVRLIDNMYKRHREELQRLCDELNVDATVYDTYDPDVNISDEGEMIRIKDMVMAHINEKKAIEALSEKMKSRHKREAVELCEEIGLTYEDFLLENY